MGGTGAFFGDGAGWCDPRSERGSAVIVALILILLVLGLAGVAFSLFRFSRERAVRPFQASAAAGMADRGLQQALSALQKKAAGEAASDPAMAFFFWGGDLNGDGIPARDGEVDWNRNGKLDVSPVTGRKTLEDADGNGIWNRPDGILEGPPGTLSDEDTGVDGVLDFMEPGYHSLTNPDPNGDNYHPIFNPTGKEGNGRIDALNPNVGGTEDRNNNSKLETVEDGSRWIRWGRKNFNISKVNQGEGEAAIDSRHYVKIVEVNSLIDLNGPDHLAARLLNNLFRTIQLSVIDTANNTVVRQTLGQNARGLEYSADLDATIGTIFNTPLAPTDPHAVQLIKRRNQLPGKRFATQDQIFEAMKKQGLLTVNDTDEWLRLREFITVHATADPTTVRQDPANPTGPPILDPRPPVNINTAPKEILQAVIMAGIDRTVIAEATAEDLFAAATKLAQAVFEYRMGIDPSTPALPSGLFSNEGRFKTWDQFENDFINRYIGSLPANPTDPIENRLLKANKDRLIAQANPNSRLQRFNPDTTTSRPIDKSQIRFPTAEFTFSGDGLFEITSLGILTSGQKLLPPFMAPTELQRVLSEGGGEIARSETVSVVKLFEVLRHTTQADFEGNSGTVQNARFAAQSYPENREDVQIGLTPTPSGSILIPSPGALAVDEKTGLVYAVSTDAGGTQVRVLNFSLATPAQVGPPISVSNATGLAILPDFPGTTLGRLSVGSVEADGPKIKIFDIGGSIVSPQPVPKVFHDIAGLASSPSKLVRMTGWESLFSAGGQIRKTFYPFADPAAIPERDDPATPENEAANLVDDDGDGRTNDQIPDPLASPESDNPATSVDERLDGIDTDGDGITDDALFPLPSRPRSSLMPPPPCPLTLPFLDLAFDRRLNQAFAVDSASNLWRIRENADGGLESSEMALSNCTLPLGFTPQGMAVDEDHGEILLTEAAGAHLILHRFSSKGDTIDRLESLTLSGSNGTTLSDSDGLITIDSAEHLAFIIGNDRNNLVVISHRGESLTQIASLGATGAQQIALDPVRKRVFVSTSGGVRMYAYTLTATPAKRLDLDGQVRLLPRALPAGNATRILFQSDFASDLNLMRPSGATPPAGAQPNPTGTMKRIGSSGEVNLPARGSVFMGDLLAPDGVVTSSTSIQAPVSVQAEILSYHPDELFGPSPDAQGDGLRRGAMEFWVKLPRLTNPWAVSEPGLANGIDEDGDGWVDDDSTHPAGQPEANSSNGIDEDGDGFVDDHVGISPTTPPQKVLLYRSFLRTEIDPFIFIRKDPTLSEEQELEAILELPPNTVQLPIRFFYRGAEVLRVEYFIFTRLFLEGFQDSNTDGLADRASVHLERYADVPPEGEFSVAYGTQTTPVRFDPVASNRVDSSSQFPMPIPGGEWLHFASSWRIDPAPNNKEAVQQNLYIDGLLQPAGTLTKTPLDPDGGNGYELISQVQDLLNNDPLPADTIVDDGFSQPTSPSFLQFGTILFDPNPNPPIAKIRATIDDLVFYRDETALPSASFNGSLRRFSARSEPFTDANSNGLFDPGEPFQDLNRDGARDAAGDLFTDLNSNGVYDAGEPFGGYYTALASPKRYKLYGEPFFDQAPINNAFGPNEPFQDYQGETRSKNIFFNALEGTSTLEDGQANFLPAGSLFNRQLNPNLNQFRTFRITGNTATQITVDGDMTGVARPGDRYGLFDPGEFYWERNRSKQHDLGEGLDDRNRNRIYDGNSYFANTFTATVPAGSRIGALTWTEVKPTGTAINVELILRAADGRILWRWFSDNISGEGIPLNLFVPEEARLEYRVNFLIQETAKASPVLDDLTVTVISNPKVLYSQEAGQPFQFDPSLGPVN